jgi:N-formylglutamate deformylase
MSDAAYERLTPDDLGLPSGVRMPVRFTPARAWSPLVISFPHVGLAWPHDLHPKPQVDFPRNADYDVHVLYDAAPQRGAASVAAVYSRLVADLNRAEDDVSRRIVPDHPAPRPRKNPGVAPLAEDPEGDRDAGRPGRGVLWTTSIGNVPLLSPPMPYAEFRDRIDRFHAPYHRALQVLLERRRQRFGYAILLDAHSMPSSVGPDLVLGTLGGDSCDPGLERAALAALRGRDPATLVVSLNEPYRGGELVRRFGRPQEGLHAFQLEVSRALYMDEQRYRLYALPAGTMAGTPRGTVDEPRSREGEAEESGGRHRVPFTPDVRRSRRLAELLARVDALVGCLADPGLAMGLPPPHPAPSSG